MTVELAYARLARELAGRVRACEPMARHTTFRVGGPAAIHLTCDTVADVHAALEILEMEECPWTVVGKGSNLLVADTGYDGAVIVLGREFKHHAVGEGVVKAGAASALGVLVQEAFRLGLSRLSWAVGIPGTLGGALAMNAGTRHGSISETVESVTLFVPGEGLTLMLGRDILWGYRTSSLAGSGVILEATLRAEGAEAVRVRAEMERYLEERKVTQPLGVACAGSVFVNPEGDLAGRLIEAAGCKGMRLGGAAVSQVHANFIVNEGGATAGDIVRLMRKIQMAVRDTHGVELRPEIKFLGRFEEA